MKRCERLRPSFVAVNACRSGEAPNKRLKLAAPAVTGPGFPCGAVSTIPFVKPFSSRRSLSAFR